MFSTPGFSNAMPKGIKCFGEIGDKECQGLGTDILRHAVVRFDLQLSHSNRDPAMSPTIAPIRGVLFMGSPLEECPNLRKA